MHVAGWYSLSHADVQFTCIIRCMASHRDLLRACVVSFVYEWPPATRQKSLLDLFLDALFYYSVRHRRGSERGGGGSGMEEARSPPNFLVARPASDISEWINSRVGLRRGHTPLLIFIGIQVCAPDLQDVPMRYHYVWRRHRKLPLFFARKQSNNSQQ